MTQEIADDRFAARIAMKPAKRVYGFTWAKIVDDRLNARYWLCVYVDDFHGLEEFFWGCIRFRQGRDRLASELRAAKKLLREHAALTKRTEP